MVPKVSRIKYSVWFLILLVFFILFNIDSLWSNSVDLAHHYALTYRISEHWWLTTNTDPTLGEMNIYPRGSHVVAAIIGTLFSSTFIGIQLTTLVSIAVIWLSILVILNSMPRRISDVALLSFFILFLTNTFILHFDLHGHEVVGNFFYSQLVAHAFLYLSLIFSMRVEKKFGELWAAISLLPIMFLIATMHLLPAIQILGLIGGISAIKIFTTYKKHDDFNKLKIAVTAIIPIASFIGLFFHPSFSAMRSIGKNNGALELHNITYPEGIISISILVLVTSFALLALWAKRKDNIIEAKYLAIYGATTAALCILQYALTFYDMGSDYAVKKYGFSLLTSLFIQLSLIVSLIAIKSNNIKTNPATSDLNITGKIILYVFGLFVLLLVVPNKKYYDASNIVEMEKKITNLAYNEIPPAPAGKSNVVIGLNDFSNTINYLFSIALAKTQRDLAIPDVLIAGELSDSNNYYKIISSSNNPIYGSSSSCASSTPGNISIIDSQCFERRIESIKLCENSFDFSKEGIAPSSIQGFSVRENHGRWTDSMTARFTCQAGGKRYNSIDLELTPFIFGPLKSQRLQISVNGYKIYQDSISVARDSNNPIILDLTKLPTSHEYTIEFYMPDATSPREVGLNEDGRRIAFSLKRVTFH